MANDKKKTARYKMLADRAGNRYQFFCDLSGALLCTTEPLLLGSAEAEVEFAWESEGRRQFNFCHKCGKWVSDAVYNPETFECVECSPWEEEPAYCPHCGEKAEQGAVICGKCKNRLRYGMIEML